MFAFIVGLVTALTGPLISLVIRAIGIGIVSYLGFNILIESIEYYILNSWSGFPTTAVQLMNLAGADSAIKIILSTLTACATYKSSVAATGIAWKKPGSPGGFSA